MRTRHTRCSLLLAAFLLGWRQYVPMKRRWPSTGLHGVTFCKKLINVRFLINYISQFCKYSRVITDSFCPFSFKILSVFLRRMLTRVTKYNRNQHEASSKQFSACFMPGSCLAYTFTINIKATNSSEMSDDFNGRDGHYITAVRASNTTICVFLITSVKRVKPKPGKKMHPSKSAQTFQQKIHLQ